MELVNKVQRKAKYVYSKGIQSLREEGPVVLTVKGTKYVYRDIKRRIVSESKLGSQKDILFINGCTLNHPSRYRVSHQMEQLNANNITCDEVWYQNISLDLLKYYRGFIIFRCPITPELEEFIAKGKYFNKTFYYDIDDLVIGDEYVEHIEYLKKMSESDLAMYMDGVRRNQKTLKLCDYAITTTPALAAELNKFVPEVFINRNVASEEMIHLSDLALKKYENSKRDDGTVHIGYLSGSITHNPDFELIKPAVKQILDKHKNARLVIAGLLDLPEDMQPYKDQIIVKPFVDWRKLPETIASLDINLAPIEDNLFNRAKSENKWTEASLVKVPTIASNVGAFQEVVENEKTGILCENTNESWYHALDRLITDTELRSEIAKNAYRIVLSNHTTVYTGPKLRGFLMKTLKRNIGFVFPGTVVRGGINVAVKHAHVLRNHGFDVTILSDDKPEENIVTPDGELLVVSKYNNQREIHAYFETLVATLWTTAHFVESYDKCLNKLYLVQNYETDFYVHGDGRKSQANCTYSSYLLKPITISRWCQNWLLDVFSREAAFCPNGIDLSWFNKVEKDFSGKIRVLVEGNSIDEYKNVDESFKITNQLDRSKFEVWYLSYDKTPKPWYKYEKFFHQIPYHEVAKIYQDCHILVKSSKVESFSYPPLEMMATGGIAIVAANGGNAEFVRHRENCMVYTVGDIDTALEYINEVLQDEKLRKILIEQGRKTAESREWENIEKDILKLYV